MIWGNPWAWLGLAAVAVPILVHLLATRHARRVPFPTLRFLPDASPTALRQRRIEDLPLLLLRCLIVALAAAALAQPWLATGARRAASAGDVDRAVVVDTSASMGRMAADTSGTLAPAASGADAQAGRADAGARADGAQASGDSAAASSDDAPAAAGAGTALATARRRARSLADDAAASTVVETADLAAGVARAVAWLDAPRREGGRAAEIVVISDFQVGSLDPRDLRSVPGRAAVRLLAVGVDADPVVEMPALRLGGVLWSATATVQGDEVAVEWRPQASTTSGPGGPDAALEAVRDRQDAALEGGRARQGAAREAGPGARDVALEPGPAGPVEGGRHEETGIEWLAAPGEHAGARAALAAAARVVARPAPPGAAGEGSPRPITVVWPGAPGRQELLERAWPVDEPWMAGIVAALPAAAGVTAASLETSAPAPDAAPASRLLLFPSVEPGTLASASLGAALLRSTGAHVPPAAELDPRTLDGAALRSWERPGGGEAPAPPGSDGRWLWLAVLVLLAVETVVRRGGTAAGRRRDADGTPASEADPRQTDAGSRHVA